MGKLKTLYLLIIMLFQMAILVFVLFYDNTEKYNIFYVDEIDSKEQIDFYCLDSNNKIACIKMMVDDVFDYEAIFNLYNSKMNSIKVGYMSPLIFYSEVNDFSVIDDCIYINMNNLTALANIDIILECFSNTYSKLGINHVSLAFGKTTYRI